MEGRNNYFDEDGGLLVSTHGKDEKSKTMINKSDAPDWLKNKYNKETDFFNTINEIKNPNANIWRDDDAE